MSDELTVREHIDAAINQIKHRRSAAGAQVRALRDANGGQNAAAREFSESITHLEDAAYRYTRGRAFQEGIEAGVDLDKPDQLAKATSKRDEGERVWVDNDGETGDA